MVPQLVQGDWFATSAAFDGRKGGDDAFSVLGNWETRKGFRDRRCHWSKKGKDTPRAMMLAGEKQEPRFKGVAGARRN